MKVALLSDIHTNVFALKAVLEDIQHRQPDIIVNLGDTLYGPLAPQASFELLQQHQCISICGNQDRQIFQASKQEVDDNPTLQFILQDLNSEAIEWMQNLPAYYALNDELFFCHGSPDCDLVYLLEDVLCGYPRLREEKDILRLLDGNKSSLVACGHTHLPRVVQLGNGQTLVNPGSVGLPAYSDDAPNAHVMENYSPHAVYAIVEKIKGQWRTEHIRVAYDYRMASSIAYSNGREDWAYSLKTGRALVV